MVFEQFAQFSKDWIAITTFASIIFGAIGVGVFWGIRQYKLLIAIFSEFKPNGGSSLRDAINKIQDTIVIVDARQWAIVAGLRDPMWESDADGGCVRANRALLDLVQRDFDEMAGSGVWADWLSAVQRKRTFECTYHVINKAGQKFNVNAIAIPFRSTSGEVVGYVGRYSKVELVQ
jgi:PAS domain-containing protein